jgi:hypothetical protein
VVDDAIVGGEVFWEVLELPELHPPITSRLVRLTAKNVHMTLDRAAVVRLTLSPLLPWSLRAVGEPEGWQR